MVYSILGLSCRSRTSEAQRELGLREVLADPHHLGSGLLVSSQVRCLGDFEVYWVYPKVGT